MTRNNNSLTLKRKLDELRTTVALPEDGDWQLLIEDTAERLALVERLNAALVSALIAVKSQDSVQTWDVIAREVSQRIEPLEAEFPNAGISDSEACSTIAYFMAVNWEPSMYTYFRYGGAQA